MEHLDTDQLFAGLCDDFESRLTKLTQVLFDFNNFEDTLEQACGEAHAWLEAKAEEYGGEAELTSNGGECIESLISDVCYKAKLCGQFQSYLFLSLICKRWGQANYKTGKQKEGYKFLAEANYYYGLWKGTLEFDEWNTCKEISQAEGADSAQKGGQARGRKFDAVKSELVRLLKTRVPAGGWKTKTIAVAEIIADLWIFIQTENEIIKKENTLLPSYRQKRQPINMKKDNLERSVLDWSRNDENIKEAFSLVLEKGRT
ncbi:hypothetical protein AB6825_10500 [Serratia proteamaculans]|uniref:hypothetical protein n=1 Tax=Serratia proteamaculans TaxID=28151 RepID=UPI0039BDADD0